MEGFEYNIPYTYKKVSEDKNSSIDIEKLINDDDNEIVLFELPKNV